MVSHMSMKKRSVSPLITLSVLFCLILLAAGCSFYRGVPQWSGSGFVTKEFLRYKRVVVLPFEGDPTGEVSDTFAHRLHDKFPEMLVLERKDLPSIFTEEDLSSGQLDEARRIKLIKATGAQALVLGSIYYPSILRWLLQVKIVDTETGEVTGRSTVEIDFIGAERAKEACDLAVQMLKLK